MSTLTLACAAAATALARVETITLPPAAPRPVEPFTMGTARNPAGLAITVDPLAIRVDGVDWTPVMGEFHFSRYPENEWREELLKMKAGGIDIVATYVFWIHHEEVEGAWDWSGRRNLRAFVEAANEAGLMVIVRCGPWCHGEVRNGGVPDWAVDKFGRGLRTDDPAYLDHVRVIYGQIAQQVRGLLWKDGGPVVGIQLENEYRGPAAHLLSLKRIAREAGLDVPLYTRTGWPALATPMPFGEILPLFGAYAEGFWDRQLTSMPGKYWAAFHFDPTRTEAAIATEQLGEREARDEADTARYPYLTCEMGGGMMSSYHRRILIHPHDVIAPVLVKVGSGSNSPGYYMYHGGENPDSRLGTTLQELQATKITNWNDMPVRNYDFQAPLGQYGQVRPHYHLGRRLHLFLSNFGRALAPMRVVLPDVRPAGRDDADTLRWSVRSHGRSGFIFVNNYERGRPLGPKPATQFSLGLPDGERVVLPSRPATIPADAMFVWPFNMDLGSQIMLAWATAQPVGSVRDDRDGRVIFFAATPGVPAEFAFDAQNGLSVEALAGTVEEVDSRMIIRDVPPGRSPALRLKLAGGAVFDLVLLDEADSLALWQGTWRGRDRAFLTRAGLVIDGDELRLTSDDPAALVVGVHPAPDGASSDGVFGTLAPDRPTPRPLVASVEPVKVAGPLRTIKPGACPTPVAAAPVDADFADAAEWRIALPAGLDLTTDPLLRLHYTGDVARITIGDTLVQDDFYNGLPVEVGLRRHASALAAGAEIRVAILPLQKDAPIFLAPEARPDFGDAASVVALRSVEIVPRYTVTVK